MEKEGKGDTPNNRQHIKDTHRPALHVVLPVVGLFGSHGSVASKTRRGQRKRMEDDHAHNVHSMVEDGEMINSFNPQLFPLPSFKEHQPHISPEAHPVVRAAYAGDTETLAALLGCKNANPKASPARSRRTKEEKSKLAEETCPRTGLTTFLAAVCSGSLSTVQMMVEQCGVCLDQTDRHGRTAFHLAAQGNHKQIFAFLLTLLRDTSDACSPATTLLALDNHDRSVLHHSCFAGAISITRALLDRIDARWLLLQSDRHGLNPIQIAIARKSDGCLEMLLEARQILHETLCGMLEDRNLFVPFFSPSIQSELDAVCTIGRSAIQPRQFVKDYMLRHFEKAQDNCGRSVLHLAIQNEAEEMVEFLLEEGADPLLVDRAGRTTIHYAVRVGSSTILRLLLDRSRPETIKTKDEEGWTATQWACFLDQDRCLQALLLAQSQTCLDPQIGPLDVAKNLLFRDTIHEPTKRLLIHWAARLSSTRCCRLLFSPRLFLHLTSLTDTQISMIDDAIRFRQLEARDIAGRSPFFYACCPVELPDAVFVDISTSLGSKKASAPMPGTPIRHSKRRSASSLSSSSSQNSTGRKDALTDQETEPKTHIVHQTDLVDLFISRGADLQHIDNLGRSVLHYVAFSGRLKIAQLLIEALQKGGRSIGAETEINSVVHDNKGYSALHAAAIGGHSELCRLLVLQGGFGGRIDVETFGPKHRTPIQEALIHGHVETFRLLLDLEANIFQLDIHGSSLASLALTRHQKKRPELCKQLLLAMFEFCDQLPRPTAHKLLRNVSNLGYSLVDANHRDMLLEFLSSHPAVALMILPNHQNKISALHLTAWISPLDQLGSLLRPLDRFCLFARKRFAASHPPICAALFDVKGHSALHFALSRSDLSLDLLDRLLSAGHTHATQLPEDFPESEHTRRTLPLCLTEHIPFDEQKQSTLQILLKNQHIKPKKIVALLRKLVLSQHNRLGDSGIRRLLLHRDQRGRNVLHDAMGRSLQRTVRFLIQIAHQLKAFEDLVGNRDAAGRSVHEDFADRKDLIQIINEPLSKPLSLTEPSPFSKHLQQVARLVENLHIEPDALASALQPQPQSLPHIPFKRSEDNTLFGDGEDREVQRYLSSSTVSRPVRKPKPSNVPDHPLKMQLSHANRLFQRSITAPPTSKTISHSGLASKMTNVSAHPSKPTTTSSQAKIPKPITMTSVVPSRPIKTISVKPQPPPSSRSTQRKPTDDVHPSARTTRTTKSSSSLSSSSSSSSSNLVPDQKIATRPVISAPRPAVVSQVADRKTRVLKETQPKIQPTVAAAKTRETAVAAPRPSKTTSLKATGAENTTTASSRASVFDRLTRDANMRLERRKHTAIN